MKHKTAGILFISILLISLVSCYGSWNFWYEGNDVDKRTEKLKYITDSSDSKFAASGISALSGKYTVLVISDTHFGRKRAPIDCDSLFDWLEEKRGTEKFPAFAICLGDAVDLGRQDEYDEYIEFCDKLMNDYGISIVMNSCGNHDIYQGHWDNWKSNCYPHTSFYKFCTEKLSWYSLDTASGTIGINQYELLKSDLKRDSRIKIIFTHYPLIQSTLVCANMAETTERNKLISDFAKNKVICVLGGHNHIDFYEDVGFKDYGLPSFGYSGVWGLLTVDENKRTASLDLIN